jgi:pilus assembly protein CpaD
MFKRNVMSRTTVGKFLLAAAAAAALGACEGGGAEIDDVPVPTSLNQRFPIEVAKGPVRLDVRASHGTLSQMQADTVRRFAQSAMENRVSIVHVRRPSGGGRSIAVAQDIADLLIQNGIPEDAIVHSTYSASATSPVLLSYIRAYAVTKECGKYMDSDTETNQNLPPSNFGCATQNNLAATVANPMDFEVPRAETPSDPMRRGQVFTDYRTPKTPATPIDQSSQVAISTVARN